MRWKLLRFPHDGTRGRIPIPGLYRPRRSVSTLSSKDESIAAILAREPSEETGQVVPILVTGSVRTVRKQKRHCFLEIGDGSTSRTLQAVLEPQLAEGLGTGTSVTLAGIWQRSPPGKKQSCELNTHEVRILGPTEAEKYPLQKKFHTSEYLRTIPHLRLRTPFAALLARLRSECDHHLSTFYRAKDFVRLQPPIITSSDCEGAGEVFSVSANASSAEPKGDGGALLKDQDHFFREIKYLTVSSQLHLEASVHEHPRVWTLSPTFRAERSDTPRHVSEFWMLETELRTESLKDIMDVVEQMIKSLLGNLESSKMLDEITSVKRRDGIESPEDRVVHSDLVSARWDGLRNTSWPIITYTQAMDILESAAIGGTAFQHRPSWRAGLQLEHEKFIAQEVGQGSPVFVTDYPREIKPFYMLPSAQTPGSTEEASTSACFDLLLPDGCEVVGGSMREHRLEPLLLSMRRHGLKPTDAREQSSVAGNDVSSSCKVGNLDWYADLRRYGSVPHGGFGLGFDRLLGYLAGVPSIRDVVPWPRYYGRCDC